MREDVLKIQGKVVSKERGFLRVELDIPSKKVIQAKVSGRMNRCYINIAVGDIVQVEMDESDLEKGRIVFRGKPKNHKDASK